MTKYKSPKNKVISKKIDSDYDIINHDEMFKRSMSNVVVAREFIEGFLPKKIVSMMDLNSLESSKDTFIEDGLQKSMSDVVLKAKFGDTQGYLYLIIEHQSRPDYWMSFRLLKYVINILDHHKNMNPKCKKLPPVYAAVFYNGKRKYKAPTKLLDLFKNPQMMQSFFTEDHQLIDITDTLDEQLLNDNIAKAISYIMKHCNDDSRQKVIESVTLFFNKLNELKNIKHYDEDLIDNIIKNVLCYNKIDKEELKTITREVNMPLAPFAQQSYDEGLNAGLYTGKLETAKNLVKYGLSIEAIAQTTGLSIEEIINLKNNS